MNADSTFAKADRGRGMTGGRADRSATLRETKFDELTANAAPVEQWQSARPPLPHCTPQLFLDDLVQFLTVRLPSPYASLDPSEPLSPSAFPVCALPGPPPDLVRPASSFLTVTPRLFYALRAVTPAPAVQVRFGWSIHPGEFPNSVLNGQALDLFNLYRAVVSRGGFKMGNAINWKGEVRPAAPSRASRASRPSHPPPLAIHGLPLRNA